jgi:carbon monoxide dehydrogenase subunit G
MKFENTFEVEAPIDEVYATLLDVERVAPCVPGAEVIEKSGDDAYTVAIKVRVGPISMTYRGNVEIVERDDANHRAVMRARARETRGQGTADARVELSLAENGAKTNGTMVADVQLAGRAAAMGRGVIQDVSAKIVSTFAHNLETMLSGQGAAAEEPAPATPPTEPAPAAPATEAPATPAPATATAGTEAPAVAAGTASVGEATGAEVGGGPEAAPAAVPPAPEGAPAPATPPTPPAPPTPPPPPRPQAAPAEEAALPVGQIVGSVLVGRLKDPKVLAGIGAAVVFVAAVRWSRNR